MFLKPINRTGHANTVPSVFSACLSPLKTVVTICCEHFSDCCVPLSCFSRLFNVHQLSLICHFSRTGEISYFKIRCSLMWVMITMSITAPSKPVCPFLPSWMLNVPDLIDLEALNILKIQVAAGAFHNSSEHFDPLKCHPKTRIAVLNEI